MHILTIYIWFIRVLLLSLHCNNKKELIMKCSVNYEKVNVMSLFHPARHVLKCVHFIYSSVAQAKKYHNLKKCDYDIINKDGDVVRQVRNCYKFPF